jgi:Predicted S-adenosylmethionine-dependent methyltransferase involved in cell envelope biogenesis
MLRPLEMAHVWLDEVLDADSLAIDATMGNGHDTKFLAQRAKKVYAFDVQEQALENTEQLLSASNLSAELILDGHENVDKYVDNCVKVAIFNLGYLPSSDKTIITKSNTTLAALAKILALLEKNGRVALMVYYGHEGGLVEKDAVENFVNKLDQREYQVMQYNAMNQKNTPPFLIMIEKLL